MRKFLLAMLLAFPAFAQDKPPDQRPPKIPDLVLVPTNSVARLLQFFGDPRIQADTPLFHTDVEPVLKLMQGCAAMQLPEGKGECPGYHIK